MSAFISQMVGLYKDPKGESVFSDFHTNDVGSRGAAAQFSTEETLRKKIIELETVLCTYQVIRYIVLGSSALYYAHPFRFLQGPSLTRQSLL